MDNETNTQLTKKERAQLKREEKQKARDRSHSIKRLKQVSVWVGVLILIGGLGYWGLQAAERSEAERPGERVTLLDADHISPGETHDGYNSNPPTSGAHGAPVNFGIYKEELPDENLVHNLEHGGIWISYTGITDTEIEELAAIARRHPNSVVMTPRAANDAPIAVASWGRLMKLDAVDEAAIESYIQENINKSPEPLAR